MDGNQKRNSGFGDGQDNMPGGWNGYNKPNFYQYNESNDRKYNTGRFQQDGNMDRRPRNYQSHNTWPGPERQNFRHNNRQYDGYQSSRQHSDRQYIQNGQNRQQTQYRQYGYREQAGRTENRMQHMPDSVRDYQPRFMQDDFQRY